MRKNTSFKIKENILYKYLTSYNLLFVTAVFLWDIVPQMVGKLYIPAVQQLFHTHTKHTRTYVNQFTFNFYKFLKSKISL